MYLNQHQHQNQHQNHEISGSRKVKINILSNETCSWVNTGAFNLPLFSKVRKANNELKYEGDKSIDI